MANKRKPRSVQASEEGLRILKEHKNNSHGSEGRRLTFERIAEKAGVDPKTVKTFFYGHRVDPESASLITEKGFGLKVSDIIDVKALEEISSKPECQKSEAVEVFNNAGLKIQVNVKHHNNTPNSGTVEFVGRSQQLAHLHQLLENNNEVVIAAIAGMGGIGKTELAIQYAKCYVNTYQGGICWLYPKRGNIGGQIVEFAITHFQNFVLPNGLTLTAQVKFCWQNWAEGQVIVVVDDVIDYREIKEFLPSEPRFKVLITTREKLSKPLARLDLSVLKPMAALALLKSLVGRERLNREPWIARQLCKRMGYLPLGLELVGQYLAQDENLSLAEMMRRLRLRHPALENPEPTMTAQRGVADAFELSWELLDENTRRLGCFFSLYAIAPIPWNPQELKIVVSQEDQQAVIERLQAQENNQEIMPASEDCLEIIENAKNKLFRLNLIQASGNANYRIHQLIREFLREKLEIRADAQYMKKLFVALMAVRTRQITRFNLDIIFSISPLIPHLEEVFDNMTENLTSSDFVKSSSVLISFYDYQGLYSLAEAWCHKCLLKIQNCFASNLLTLRRTLTLQVRLATIIRLQGRYPDSEELYKKSLIFAKKIFNEHDNVFLEIQHSLALVYMLQNRFDEADSLLNKCLESIIKNNKYILETSSHSLSKFSETQSDFTELKIANRMYLDQTANNIHPDYDIFISVLNTLGRSYQEQGKYSEAEDILKKSLNFVKNLLGDHHPDIAVYQQNLALLYKEQGQYKKSEDIFLQCLSIFRSSFGENHPLLACILGNLGEIYRMQCNRDQAELFLNRALEIRRKFLGKNHPDYASSLNDLGLFYLDSGRYEEAESLFQEALQIKKKLMGNQHLEYAIPLNNLAITYFHKNQLLEAEQLYL